MAAMATTLHPSDLPLASGGVAAAGGLALTSISTGPQTSPAVPDSHSDNALNGGCGDCDAVLDCDATSLRSVGAIFTMTASGFSAMSAETASPNTCSSFELGELTRQLTCTIFDAACDRHVWFHSPANSAVAITPYAQVYGLHPRFFNFCEGGTMKLTPVGHMLHSAGLSLALSSRSRSCSPRASRSSRSSTPRRSSARLSSTSSSCSATQASAATLPPGTTAAELLRDPVRALEFFQQHACARWGLGERKVLLQDYLTLAKTLNTEAKDVRSLVGEAKQRLAKLRGGNECEAAALGNDVVRTLSPEELTTINEIEGLRARFQELTWELWRVKAEVDKLQHSLEEDAITMQREFESWFVWLRRRARSMSTTAPLPVRGVSE